ncbi:MAG: hypothetical protein ACI8PZ_004010 [Myxococcota bacterium]|jgi:hypothetical protein
MLALLLALVPVHAATLTITGECPGTLDLLLGGVAPGADVFLLVGAGPGSDAIPGGPCADADSSLSGLARHFGPFRTDIAGEFLISRSFGGGLCPRYASVLDAATCTTSSAVPFAPGDDEFAHDNGLGVLWYNGVPTGTVDEAQASLSCEASYPGMCERRDGDCAGSGYCYSGDPSYEPCWGWESGCSGDAGRVWEYGSSYTTYGYWD